MKSVIVLLAAALGVSIANAQTNPPDLKQVAQDVAKIKQSIGNDIEIAGAYKIDPSTGQPALRTGDDYLTAVANSYIFADFNKDGLQDLAVVIEDQPNVLSNGLVTMGNRTFAMLTGWKAKDGEVYLEDTLVNSQLVLAADGGGTLGDPFSGLALTKTNAITVSHYGGSAQRWALVQTYQFRNGDFYWIGDTRTQYDDHTQVGTVTDIDLITGDEIITNMLANGKDQIVHKKLPVKPLVRMAVANPNPNW